MLPFNIAYCPVSIVGAIVDLGLIRSIAKEAAKEFNCLHVDKDRPEEFTSYTKTILDDLCGEGALEFLTRLQSREYDESRAMLTTYLYPHLKGRMTRWLERSIGNLALSKNDMEAARLGLRTVIPEGTTFDLNISGGKARVDMSREALNCLSAEEEALMVQAVASTLTCFDTVEEVSFLFDGQARSKLTHGTDVSGAFNGDYVNMESVTTSAGAHGDQVQLYFPSQTGRVLVPVTRTVFSDADLTTALVELAKGPWNDSGLERPLPADCGVKSVTVKNGTAVIDFSKGFMDVTSQSDGGRQAIRAIQFTAGQFPGVKKVELRVEGEKFTLPEESTATFINEAAEVMAQYPGVVEID